MNQNKLNEILDDNFAKVELYRWQYGQLDDTSKKLDESIGLENLALSIENAVEQKNMGLTISPYNLCEVLRYVARKLRKTNDKSL